MLTIAVCNIPTGVKVWIEDVVVDESQRGKGIGMELMNTAINFAITLGAKSVELTSRPSRIEANKLYLKMGFVLRETNVYRYHLK
jgi:GNAT superfamily N-acetyltransferase